MRRRARSRPGRGSGMPGWALALLLTSAGALLAWLHVAVLLGA